MPASRSLDGVAVVLVNFGAHDLLSTNLRPLEGTGIDIVVVDNFASVHSRAAITDLARDRRWTLLAQPDNPGFGTACNIGVAAATGRGADVVMLLNPDARIEPEDVRRMADLVRGNPMTLTGPTILDASGHPWSQGTRLGLSTGRILGPRSPVGTDPRGEVPWLTGACLVFTAELWTAVGGMADEYFLYWEDVELSHRVWSVGGRVETCPGAVAVHDEGSTHTDQRGSREKSGTYYRFNMRNRLLFAARNLPPEDVRRWLWATPRENSRILLRGGRRQLLRPWRIVPPVVSGSVAGAAYASRALSAGRRPPYEGNMT